MKSISFDAPTKRRSRTDDVHVVVTCTKHRIQEMAVRVAHFVNLIKVVAHETIDQYVLRFGCDINGLENVWDLIIVDPHQVGLVEVAEEKCLIVLVV